MLPDYIDSKKIFNKFEITPIVESKELLNDYYRSTLKDYTPDKATLTSDQQRKNKGSQSILNSRYNGSRSGVEPYAPDLFLGDLEPDSRGTFDGPLMGNYKKQLWHRKDDYRKAFKDDSSNSIHSAGVTEAKVLENKKLAYNGLKNRYKNFNESMNISSSNNTVFKNKSIVDNQEVDIVLADINDKKIDNQNNNIITNKPSISKGWESLPDHKIKVADYNKLIKQADISNTNIRKNKDQGVVDIEVNKSNETQNNINKQLSVITSNFMNKKRNSIKTVTTKFKSSLKDNNRKINKNREHFKNNEIKTVQLDDKRSNFMEVIDKEYKINKAMLDIRKNISNFTSDKKDYDKGNNKETIISSTKKITSLLTDILQKSIMSNNDGFLNKGNNKESINNKVRNINNDHLLSKFIQQSVEVNKDVLNKSNNNYEIYNYKSKLPELANNYVNDKTSIEKKLYSYDNEKKLNNISSKIGYEIKTIMDFENDAEYATSGTVSSAAGTVGSIGSKYLNNKKEYESSILDDNNVNDSGSILLKRV